MQSYMLFVYFDVFNSFMLRLCLFQDQRSLRHSQTDTFTVLHYYYQRHMILLTLPFRFH